NTLREDIIDVVSNNTTFGYAEGQYYDNSQMMFGSEKTNREVREEQNREARAYGNALREKYIEQRQAILNSTPKNSFSISKTADGGFLFKFGLFNRFRRGLAHALNLKG